MSARARRVTVGGRTRPRRRSAKPRGLGTMEIWGVDGLGVDGLGVDGLGATA